ncbi:Gfo/Idh/MocA family protein [Streptomyces sp. enrichment culture]|uniref:Gfo/Idh/MocA family protein n=1 Tax=Streptomyces sp. enrichment culture TaxID=1795815 RepID=UPI003F543551
MPVGVIGLGGIAQKAYLPVLGAMPELDLRLMTRDADKLARIGQSYRAHRLFTDLDALIDSGIRAAFVHTPTETHHDIVTRLLDAGVDVLVDKPLSYTLSESRQTAELARERGRSLMVGFNRRHAPAYLQALDTPRDLVVLQKDRRARTGDVRTIVLDDFIHLVDTLRMLAPEGVAYDVHGKVEDGQLHHAVLRATGPGFTGLAVMNRAGGSAGETLQTAGADHRLDVVNLTDVIDHDTVPALRRGADWESVGRRRGFEGMCRYFLNAVRTGERIDAGDALVTHEWCEEIIDRLLSA